MITIATWNVNSVRTRLSQLLDWLTLDKPDIVLLQELKCVNENFPYQPIEDLGYNIVVHGQKSYNGVAILSKFPLEDVSIAFSNDPDPTHSRYIEAIATVNNNQIIRLVSVYVPNGQEVGSDKFHYKLAFLEALGLHFKQLLSYNETLVIGGDFNVAPESIDVYDPPRLEGTICFHPEEKAAYRRMINNGLYDAYRTLHPDGSDFSWWDYRGGSWQYNKGMRIDHLLLSSEAMTLLKDCKTDKSVRELPKSSDHAPVICTLSI